MQPYKGMSMVKNSILTKRIASFLAAIVTLITMHKFNNKQRLGFEAEEQLKAISNCYNNCDSDDSDMTFVVLNESLGVPMEGPNTKVFSDIICEKLGDLGLHITYINASFMKVNKTWHIDRILKGNLSVAEIKKIQALSIDLARNNGIIEKIGLSENIKERYVIEQQDFDVHISSEISKASDPIIFYTCGANNLMHVLNSDPISPLYRPEVRDEVLRRIDEENIFESITIDIANNFRNIYAINDKTKIYCLGLYTPLIIERLKVIFPKITKFDEVIGLYNSKVKAVCDEYGVIFVDNSHLSRYCRAGGFDFHPNEEGQYQLAKNVINEIFNNINYQNDNAKINEMFLVDNSGIDALIAGESSDVDKALRMLNVIKDPDSYAYGEWVGKGKEYLGQIEMLKKAKQELDEQYSTTYNKK